MSLFDRISYNSPLLALIKHISLLSFLPIHQARSYLLAFALALSSAWGALLALFAWRALPSTFSLNGDYQSQWRYYIFTEAFSDALVHVPPSPFSLSSLFFFPPPPPSSFLPSLANIFGALNPARQQPGHLTDDSKSNVTFDKVPRACLHFGNKQAWDFSGGSVLENPPSKSGGEGFDPCSGN